MAPPPKYKALLNGPIGRGLIVAEVVTLVGSAALYWKLTTSPEARDKLGSFFLWLRFRGLAVPSLPSLHLHTHQLTLSHHAGEKMPWLMEGFHKVTQNKYKN